MTDKQILGDERVRQAAPEMLEILEAIAGYWYDYESGRVDAALHPGALITDKEECIADLVRAVVRKAKEGE